MKRVESLFVLGRQPNLKICDVSAVSTPMFITEYLLCSMFSKSTRSTHSWTGLVPIFTVLSYLDLSCKMSVKYRDVLLISSLLDTSGPANGTLQRDPERKTAENSPTRNHCRNAHERSPRK